MVDGLRKTLNTENTEQENTIYVANSQDMSGIFRKERDQHKRRQSICNESRWYPRSKGRVNIVRVDTAHVTTGGPTRSVDRKLRVNSSYALGCEVDIKRRSQRMLWSSLLLTLFLNKSPTDTVGPTGALFDTIKSQTQTFDESKNPIKISYEFRPLKTRTERQRKREDRT